MKKRLIILSLALCLFNPSAQAADTVHTFGDGNTFNVDDCGGCLVGGTYNLSYFLNFGLMDQSALGTLLLHSQDQVYSGLDLGFTGGSGVQIFDLSEVPETTTLGQVGLAQVAPLTPVSFLAGDFLVEQVSYTTLLPGDDFIVLEYTVTNLSDTERPVQLALSNDFDVQLKASDTSAQYEYNPDLGIPHTVSQTQGPPLDPLNTTVGVSLLYGDYARHRLEICGGEFGFCDILENPAVQLGFFQDNPAEQGDLTGGLNNRDFAVTLAANLGNLDPGQSGSVVFCYNSAINGDILSTSSLCEEFYNTEIKICGNGLKNSDEECDQGDQNNNNNCVDYPDDDGTCLLARCGDGYVWNEEDGSEFCDDGNENNNDSCPDGAAGSCQAAICGDGFLWNTDGGSEVCDNGTNNSDVLADACRTNCVPASCGDSVRDTGEACDNGGANSDVLADACRTDCSLATCGDGVTDTGEECDDANTLQNDGCLNNCSFASCGDGFIQEGVEACDDGNAEVQDACPSGPLGTCQIATCGDGFIDRASGEERCDDSNQINGDGCSQDCFLENCGNGVVDAYETCDDGNDILTDECVSGPTGTCLPAACGDGYVQQGVEECDDGNQQNDDGCSAECIFEIPVPICGNGIVEDGEECEDGNDNDEDYCRNDCTWNLVIQGGGASSDPQRLASGCALNKNPGHPNSAILLQGLSLLVGLWVVRRLSLKAKNELLG